MLIQKTSTWSGILNQMEIPMTQDQFDRLEKREEFIQNIFPKLTATQREFLITGMNEKEQDEVFGDSPEL